MTRLLILTAGFGEGHNAAARNLRAAAELMHGEACARCEDLFELASPRLNRLSRKAYLHVINRHPGLWSGFYGWVDRAEVFPRHLWFLRRELAEFRRLLELHRPEAVCSTYPVYGFMADRLRAAGLLRAPFHNIVTDSISINRLWTRPSCRSWFVPNEESAGVVRSLGVSNELIHNEGFPVQPFFSREGRRLAPPALGPGARPRVLYILNSGVAGAERTARLLCRDTDWELTFAVGRDEALHARLGAVAAGRSHRTTLLRWTNDIPALLCTHHAVVSKAGGATTQEAISARCPMIVNQVVPGQEEGNFELLRRRGAGARSDSPEQTVALLRAAFADGGRQWSQWRARLEDLARPEAAFRIVGHMLGGGAGEAAAPLATQERKP